MNNLDFEVVKTPIYYGESMSESKDHIGLVRDDNNDLLSIMKNSYKPLYVKDFKEIVSRLQKASKFDFESYGTFDNGRIILAYLKNNRKLNSVAGFPMKDYMTIGTSFNGKTSTFIGSSNIMIRCMNSFSAIDRENKFRHTTSAELRLEDFLQQIEKYFHITENMYKEFNAWQSMKIDKNIAKSAIEKFVDWDSGNEDENSVRKSNIAEQLKTCIQVETNAIGDTMFGLFNGFTRYSTHHLNKSKSSFGAIVGNNYAANEKAYKIIKKLENSM